MTVTERVIRLDRNESPMPPDPAVVAGLAEVLREVNQYPRGAWQAALTESLAAHNGCSPEQIVLGPGSVRLLDMVWRAVLRPGTRVGYAVPGFEMYALLTAQQGATPVEVALTQELGTDLDRLAALAVSEPLALAAVANPHNPSGSRCSPTELAGFVARVPLGTVVVVDEAYAEFDEQADPVATAALATGAPNVVVTRTFSKAFGLAGLRIGYAIASRELITRIGAFSMPFSVTDLACAAAVDVLARTEEHKARMTRLRSERASLTAQLRACGLDVPASAANFVLVAGRPELAAHLSAHGVAVSSSSIGTRITVGEEQDRTAVLAALRSAPRPDGAAERRTVPE